MFYHYHELKNYKIDENSILYSFYCNVQELLDLKYLEIVTIEHKIATFLHPNFKKFHFIQDTAERARELSAVKLAIALRLSKLPSKQISEVEIIEPEPKREKEDSKYHVDSSDEEDQISSELDDYIKEKVKKVYENPLKYWELSSHHGLAEIAKEVFSLLASSSLSERAFSYAGKITRPDRASIKPKTLSSLSCFSTNIKIRN